MNDQEVLLDWLDELALRLYDVIGQTTAEALHWQPDVEANSIALTLWHIGRAWDVLVVCVLDEQDPENEIWHRLGWREKTGYDPRGKGLAGVGNLSGYSLAEAAEVPKLSRDELVAYLNQAHQALRDRLLQLQPDELYELRAKRLGLPQPAYVWVSNFLRDGYEHLGEVKAIEGLWSRKEHRLTNERRSKSRATIRSDDSPHI